MKFSYSTASSHLSHFLILMIGAISIRIKWSSTNCIVKSMWWIINIIIMSSASVTNIVISYKPDTAPRVPGDIHDIDIIHIILIGVM